MQQEPLGRRIQVLRETRGWSQTELAQRTRLSQTVISKLERGASMRASAATLHALAAAFDVTIEDLISPDSPAAPPSPLEVALFRVMDVEHYSLASFDVARALVRRVTLSLAPSSKSTANDLARSVLDAAKALEDAGERLTVDGVAARLYKTTAASVGAPPNRTAVPPSPPRTDPPFIRVPTPPGATPAVRPRAVAPAAREIFETPHHGTTPAPLPEGKAKRASGTKPK